MLRRLLLLVLLCLVTLAPRCGEPRRGEAEFSGYAERYTPFRDYGNDCFAAWDDAAGLLAALELDRRGEETGFEIGPEEAEAYVQHMALEVLDQFYDPAAEGSWGRCNGNISTPLPDPPTGVAALAYMLKRFGTEWSHETRDALRRAIELPDWKYDQDEPKVYNKTIPFPVMRLLFGEAACYAPSWERGWQQIRSMYESHMRHGAFESNDRHYSSYHFANLGLAVEGLEDSTARDMALYLHDLKALLSAHLYLPGGHIGVLNTRLSSTPFHTPGSQRELDMAPMLESMAGRAIRVQYAQRYYVPRPGVVVAEILWKERPLPARIREIFRNKGTGYELWWLMKSSRSSARYPGTVSNLGEDGALAFAWQVHVLHSGHAAMGSSYGKWAPGVGNSEGVAVRCEGCDQGFAFLWQWIPCAPGDTDDAGALLCGDANPDASPEATPEKKPLYDFERMQVHRSRITLFDPRTRETRWEALRPLTVPRAHELSQTWITNWDHPEVGGEKIFPTPGGWYLGRVGKAFIAYRPLADTVTATLQDGERAGGGRIADLATLLQMPGRSGGITEIATADDFPGETLADFAAEMDARYWSFEPAGLHDAPVAEFDFRDASGTLCRMRLEYMGDDTLPGKERRYLDCQGTLGDSFIEQREPVFFAPLYGGAPIASPHVSYDIESDVLRVPERDGELVYEFGRVRDEAQFIVPPPGCEDRAYLEPPEQLPALQTPFGSPVPDFDFALVNQGFAAATARFEFIGDDCTPGTTSLPNENWLVPPPDTTLEPGEPISLRATGSPKRCAPGVYGGEIVVDSLEGNLQPLRLPVSFTVD